MTINTLILVNVLLGAVLVGGLLSLLGHAIHADRFIHRHHLRVVPREEAERIAA